MFCFLVVLLIYFRERSYLFRKCWWGFVLGVGCVVVGEVGGWIQLVLFYFLVCICFVDIVCFGRFVSIEGLGGKEGGVFYCCFLLGCDFGISGWFRQGNNVGDRFFDRVFGFLCCFLLEVSFVFNGKCGFWGYQRFCFVIRVVRLFCFCVEFC